MCIYLYHIYLSKKCMFESSESVSELAREAWPSQAKDGDSKAPPLWKLTFDDPNSEFSLPYLPDPLPETQVPSRIPEYPVSIKHILILCKTRCFPLKGPSTLNL